MAARTSPRPRAPCGGCRSSVAAELPLGAASAVERELRRLVVGEVCLPPVTIRRQPHLGALGALEDEGVLCAHARRSKVSRNSRSAHSGQ